jgi:mycothiol synthase
MRRPHLEAIPEPCPLPARYALREATEADGPALAGVLTRAFAEPWSVERVNEVLLAHPEVPTTFLIEHAGVPMATASFQLKPEEFPASGWVHYVGAEPAHAGRGLGAAVVVAVLRAARDAGKQDAMLTTDDPRLPAIRTYLKLGFEPDLWHPSHPERWQAIYAALGVSA